MTTTTQETRYPLPARAIFALEHAERHVLGCVSGELWLTLDGEQRDIVLRPGEQWQISGGCAVVSALQDAVLTLEAPASARIASTPRQHGAEWTLAALLRWKHPAISTWPATLLR